ncbi:MAG: patatin-like phospholipase family protein [Spirochaetales bacterium]
MERLQDGYCLVLSGGGAKGVYHIGVWRALKELGIGVQAFVGTSIGAIMAALLAQGSDAELETIGKTITLDAILALPPELLGGLVEHRGLDTAPLRALLEQHIQEPALRRSGVDLGIVTVNLSSLKAEELFLDSIPEGSLIDYLMASSAFPGFSTPVIEGKRYVDGGLHDNIPHAVARKRGYTKVIVSDISGFGFKKAPDVEGSVTVFIKSSIKMGSVLDFRREFLDDFTLLGYLDTLRTFGVLHGRDYAVEPNPEAEVAFAREPTRIATAREVLPDERKLDRLVWLQLLECSALVFGVPRVRRTTYEELARAVVDRRTAEDAQVAELAQVEGSGRLSLLNTLREAVSKKSLNWSPYVTWKLLEHLVPAQADRLVLRTLSALQPELPAALQALQTLDQATALT